MRSHVTVSNGFAVAAANIRDGASLVVGKTTGDLESEVKQNIVAVGAVDSGTMLNTTEGHHEPGSLEGELTNATDYWPHVNYGTHKMPARPVLEPGVDAVQPGFDAAMREVVERG